MRCNSMHIKFKRIWHLVLAAELPALICGLFTYFALQTVITNTNHATKNEEKARLAIKSASQVQKILLHGLVSVGQFEGSGRGSDLKGYYETTALLDRVNSQLQDLAVNYPGEASIIDDLRKLAKYYRELGDEAVALKRLGTNFAPWRLSQLQNEGEYAFTKWGELSPLLSESLEQDLRLSPVSSQSYTATLSRILLVALAAVFAACLITSSVLTNYIDKRLAIIRDNSRRLASGHPLHSLMDGSDEISTLDKEFHAMAAAIAEVTRIEKDILENASDIIITIDQHLTVQSANRACVRLWKDKELVATSILGLAPERVHDRMQRFFDHCRHSGTPGFIEIPMISNPQRELFVSVAAQWSGENQLFSCMLHDITTRKQAEDVVRASEKRLRAMLEEMPAGMLLIDQSFNVIGSNHLSALLLGATADELLNRPLSDLLEGAGKTRIDLGWLNQAKATKHVLAPVLPNADTTHLEVSVDTVAFPGGECFLLVLLDITAAQNLEALRRQLIDAITSKIVRPLKAINSALALLNDTVSKQSNELLSKFLKTAFQESDRLLKLFSELLEIESSNIRQLSVHKTIVSVQDLLERSLEAVRITAEKRGIRLIGTATTARLYADPDRIVQVLINLVFNALKFTPSGGYVKLEAEEVDGNTLELRVIDSGCGIPSGMEEAIFEPFKQVSASDALSKGGSGLGLFICKSIVEKHDGTIAAKNHTDGATFYIRLPIK